MSTMVWSYIAIELSILNLKTMYMLLISSNSHFNSHLTLCLVLMMLFVEVELMTLLHSL